MICTNESKRRANSVDSSSRESPRSAIAQLFDWQRPGLPSKGIVPLIDCHQPNKEIKALTTALLNFTPIESEDLESCSNNQRPVLVEPLRSHTNSRQRYVGQAAVTGFQDSIRPAHPRPEILRCHSSANKAPHGCPITNSPHSINRNPQPAQQAIGVCQPKGKSSQLPSVGKRSNYNIHHSHSMHHPLMGRERETRRSLPNRPSSRAIAIPTRPANVSKDQEDEMRDMETAMLEYDYATWRLYNRLILYRQSRRRRGTESGDRMAQTTPDEEEHDENRDSMTVATTKAKTTSSFTTTSMQEEYGGVFDLEL